MEVEVNSNSPFSGPSPKIFRISKRSIGSVQQNDNESFDSDKAVFESSPGADSFMIIPSSKSQKSLANRFSASVLDEAKNKNKKRFSHLSAQIRKMGESKRNKERCSFTFDPTVYK
jgi:hypothetical protein